MSATEAIIHSLVESPTDGQNAGNSLPTDDKWVLWYHAVDNDDWTLESYVQLPAISSIEEYYGMINSLPNISAGMFFLMKDGISPLWEDPANRKGGYWSFKVPKSQSNEIWSDLSAALVGGDLTIKPEQMKFINGISFSPKISNAIFRIWLSDYRQNEIKKIISNKIPGIDTSEAFFNKYTK